MDDVEIPSAVETAPITLDPLQDLMQAIGQSDVEAFALLQASTSGLLVGIAKRYLRNRADVDEVVGDVYVRVWYQSRRFDPKKGTVHGWLSTMCRNATFDQLRKLRLRGASRFSEAEEELVDDLTPERLVEQSQIHLMLAGAVARLPIQQRQMLAASFDAGSSHREISLTLGIPLGTVKSHLNRTLKRLQRELSATMLPEPLRRMDVGLWGNLPAGAQNTREQR